MDSVNCQEQLPDVKKNFIYRTLYEILTVITPFITTPYVSRVLGADGIGIYSYTASIMAYFTLFAALRCRMGNGKSPGTEMIQKKAASYFGKLS